MNEAQQIGALQAKVSALEKSLDAAKVDYKKREDDLEDRLLALEKLRGNGRFVFRIVLWVGGAATFAVTQWKSIVDFTGTFK